MIVLGIGNRLMEDDGIGVRVVEALMREREPAKVRFAAGETDVDYCLGELADGEYCIIIDGGYKGIEPGTVCIRDLKRVLAQKKPSLHFHDFDLLGAMKRENFIKDGVLITIEVCSVNFSADLSPVMEERFEEIVGEVRGIIGSCLLAGKPFKDKIS